MDVFDGIIRLVDQRSVRLGVVMIPTLQQVEGRVSTRVQEVFRDFFADRGIATLDLLPALEGRTDVYFSIDEHWNAVGHRVAAETIAAWYATMGLSVE